MTLRCFKEFLIILKSILNKDTPTYCHNYFILLLILLLRGVMANIYLRKTLYDEIIRLGKDPSSFVKELVENELKRLRDKNEE